MEDHPGNVQPDLSTRRLPSPAKRNARWTLLFVGDHGRTVRIKRFKGLLYLAGIVLLVALGTAAGLYLVNRHTIEENRSLAAEVTELREEVSALRYEKDVLTARLVLTEAELRRKGPTTERPAAAEELPADAAEGPEEPDAGEAPVPAPAEKPPVPAPGDSAAQDRAEVEPPAAAGDASEGSPNSAAQDNPVSLEDLSVAHEKDRALLRVTFVIRKDAPEPESVSGHAFVVLKPSAESSTDSWVSLPWAKFEAGRPVPPRRGQFFSIARFKPMKFEASEISNPDRFDRLTVFVFDTRGGLLLRQDFSMAENLPETG